MVTVSLLPLIDPVPETTLHGGYNVSIDQYGRVTGLDQAIYIRNAGTFALGDYDVTVNSLGSITNITRNSSGGDDDPAATGLTSAGTMFQYTWYSAGTDIEVAFKLAKKSHVRLIFTPNSNNAPGGLSVDVDGTLDFDRHMDYLGGLAIYSRTQVAM